MPSNTIVTIGAGQTAAVAARTLRRRGFDGRIVLIGDECHAPYQRPPLSKEFLAGQCDSESLMLLPEAWREKNDIELLSGSSAVRIDSAAGAVELADGRTLTADSVLIATGGRPRTMAVEGSEPERVHYLRTIDDAQRLADVLRPGARLTLIGGGFIGLEIASTAAQLGVQVTVLEAGPLPLSRLLGDRIARACADLQRSNGIEVRTSATVENISSDSSGVRVRLTGGELISSDLAVLGIGIEPNTAVAEASGITVQHGILVDAQGRTSIPSVYAAGDVAARFSDRAGRHIRVEHFDNASKQGAATANLMLGRIGVVDPAHWFWSDQFGVNVQFTGSAQHTDLVVRGDINAGVFTAFYLDDGILRGACAFDRGEDIGAARELVGRALDPKILADPDVELFDLLADDEEMVTS
ncbi:FAD-dependent oxidoreductase [Nocardia sp. NPDC051990]|uniref:NAD(P)/FAD-dependent oxidoreductase n=1 Tax=Nocardia sp. NPDC051990 TaxID=3155285 RepID=UPI003422CF9F